MKKEVKEAGRGETDSHPPIPEETINAIFKLAADHQEVLEARFQKDRPRYEQALLNLPEAYRNKYHASLSNVMQFQLTLMDGRRGAEGIEKLTINHWQIVDEPGRKKYAKKVSKFWVISNFGLYPIQNCKKKLLLTSFYRFLVKKPKIIRLALNGWKTLGYSMTLQILRQD